MPILTLILEYNEHWIRKYNNKHNLCTKKHVGNDRTTQISGVNEKMADFLHVKNRASMLKAVLQYEAVFGLDTLIHCWLSTRVKYAINSSCRKSFWYEFGRKCQNTYFGLFY